MTTSYPAFLGALPEPEDNPGGGPVDGYTYAAWYYAAQAANSAAAAAQSASTGAALVTSVGLNGAITSSGLLDLNNAPIGRFIAVNGTAAEGATLNWPAPVGTGTAAQWWNVFTFGAANRLTQVAYYGFTQGDSRVAVRTKHDSTWLGWRYLNLGASSTLDLTGATDAAPALNTLLTALSAAGGGTIAFDSGAVLLIDTQLNVPKNCALVGPWRDHPPDESATRDYNARTGQLIVNSATTIALGEDAALVGWQVIRKGLALPFASSAAAQAGVAAFAGTAITCNAAGPVCSSLLVLGFAQAISCVGRERPYFYRIRGDCTSGIRVSNCFDIARLSECHFWPYLTTHQSWTFDPVTSPDYAVAQAGVLLTRTGKAYRFDNVGDWNTITESFSYGYRTGYEVDSCANVQLIGCGADYYGPITGAVSTAYSIIGTTLDCDLLACQAAGQGSGITVNSTTAGEACRIVSCNLWDNDTQAVSVVNGRTAINGSSIRGGTLGVVVDAASDGATIVGCTFSAVATLAIGPDLATLLATGSIVVGNRAINGTPALLSPIHEVAGQRVIFKGGIGSATGDDLSIVASGNRVELGNSLGVGVRIGGGTAAPVNTWRFAPNSTGNPAFAFAEGADANVGMTFQAKGTGSQIFQNNQGQSLEVGGNPAATINYLRIAGAATAGRPTLSAQGGDTNIDWSLLAKGNGLTYVGNGNGTSLAIGTGTATLVNYIRIAGQPTGLPPTFVAEGTDANIDIKFNPKGTGGFQQPGPPVNTVTGTAYTVLPGDVGKYLRFTATSAKAATFDSTLAFGEYHLRNVGTANLTLTAGAGVTLNAPYSGTLNVPPAGTVTVKKVGGAEFDVFGVTV